MNTQARVAIVALGLLGSGRGLSQEMFAGYDAFCGLPVVVGPDPQTATAQRFPDGSPFIHIDPRAMANWTASRLFVLAHECAHHRLGHTTHLGAQMRFMGGPRQQELEADCWAAKALQSIGQLGDINRQVIESASQGHFAQGGYPTGAERAQAVMQCLGVVDPVVTRTCWMEPCSHPAHPGGDQAPCAHRTQLHAFDVMPCQHNCMPYGPCHPMGDQIPCQHIGQMHAFDVSPCSHPAHSEGHQVCR